ncbi:MAG: DoxX family protein [Actinobacteria bacterium]|nr:MAG: DoxX family protein [Actinomycetota bacterium]
MPPVDIGLLILRLVIGTLFIGHGTQKLFGWWNGGGPVGTARFFDEVGFRPAPPLVIVAGLTETGGGSLILLGLVTSLGAAAVIGVMTAAGIVVHLPNGLWNTKGGIELPLVNAAAVAALAFSGPGRYSVDRLIGWHLRGSGWGLAATVLGLAAGLAMAGWQHAQTGGAHVPEAELDQPRRAA